MILLTELIPLISSNFRASPCKIRQTRRLARERRGWDSSPCPRTAWL